MKIGGVPDLYGSVIFLQCNVFLALSNSRNKLIPVGEMLRTVCMCKKIGSAQAQSLYELLFPNYYNLMLI
jgi:hypothetical protein